MNADGSTQTNLSQFASWDTDPSWQTVPSADLALSLVASPTEGKVQKPLKYTIRVENAGASNANSVVVTDDLSAEHRFVSVSSSQGSCQAPPVGTNGTVTCNLGFVLKGQSATVDIVVKLAATRRAAITNTASVTGSAPDPNTTNNSATISTPLK